MPSSLEFGRAGSIPDALSGLAALNKLNLNFNRFDGLSIHSIPHSIAVLLSNGCQVSLYANKSFLDLDFGLTRHPRDRERDNWDEVLDEAEAWADGAGDKSLDSDMGSVDRHHAARLSRVDN